MVFVRTIQPGEASDWERMRQKLWPSPTAGHAREIAAFFHGDRSDPAEVLVAVGEGGELIGFAETTIRSHVEGCRPGRVAYLEGWFVEEGHRGQGVGAALMQAVEEWGQAQGCTELGSDTELANARGAAAHRALGFTEVERIVCLRKSL